MRPPECVICGTNDEGTCLLGFAMDPEAADWYKRAEEAGFVGHPPDQEWFCRAHAQRASTLTDLTLGEALRTMRGA